MIEPIDLSGQRFGSLTAVRFVGCRRNFGSTWVFRCVCGTEIERLSKNVKRGNPKHCGCGGVKPEFTDPFAGCAWLASGFPRDTTTGRQYKHGQIDGLTIMDELRRDCGVTDEDE